jgi:hypothetical protein
MGLIGLRDWLNEQASAFKIILILLILSKISPAFFMFLLSKFPRRMALTLRAALAD